MSTDYNYDDQGQFFPFFILTISGLITLPLTYDLLKPSTELKSTAPRIQTDFKLEDDDLIQGQKRKQKRRERKFKRFIATIVGYAVMAWMIYLIMVTQRTVTKLWDPYEILDISRSATEQAIKKQFRKLTLQYHPDKAQVDPSQNQTLDEITDHYVEISKAYKALTDEEVRNNYIQYGHPDGKQSFSIGIALPTFIVTEGNGKYTLGLYGGLLGVLLPYLVGKWWYGSQRMTKEKVLVQSAGNLFREWKEDLSRGTVVCALSSGEEYKQVLKGNRADAGLGKIEKAVLAEGDGSTSISGMTAKEQKALKNYDGSRRKAAALLWAYLGRIKLHDQALDDEKYEVAPLALALNESMVAICLAYGNLLPLLNTMGAAQNLIQAIPPGSSPLLQLPHITPEIAAKIEGNAKVHMNVQQFMDLPDAQRRKAAVKTGGLTTQQYVDVLTVAKQLPVLKVEKAFFKCMGEKHIVTGSLVQFVIKARIIPPGTGNVPEVSEVDLEDVDPDEDDIDGLLGRKPPKKLQGKDVTAPVEQTVPPPLAFAPYFARDHPPRWHVFLSDVRQGRVAVPPTNFTTFNKPIFHDDGKPTFNVQTLKMQFQAPPQAGKYTFGMNLISDSYIGMDTRQEVVLDVEDQAKAMEIEEDEEISEPEEDSLAGQMNALKQGSFSPTKATPRRKKLAPKQESDDESDTEGEEEDEDLSDTDTDTDSDED